MFQNYLHTALRNFRSHKWLTLLNSMGLAIGICTCFFVYQYVYFESSFDRFHVNSERLYRVGIRYEGATPDAGSAGNHPAVGRAMKDEMAEVQDFVRLFPLAVCLNSSMPAGIEPRPGIVVSVNKDGREPIAFHEERIFLADSSFFRLFSYSLLKGDPAMVLKRPNTIVLSESMASKYFGKENPVGKTVSINGQWNLQVTGVFQDVPTNSHIHFDMLISIVSIDQGFINDRWTWPEFYNYVLLKPGAQAHEVEAKLPAFVLRHMGEIMKHFGLKVSFFLTPVTDIHLKSGQFYEPEPQGSATSVSLLAIIGGFVLVIAWINYTNVALARSLKRAKEVGLRKVVGADRLQVIGQFIVEALVLNVFAIILAVIFAIIAVVSSGGNFGTAAINAMKTAPLWHSMHFWMVALTVLVGGTLLSGGYPAFLLSRLRAINALKEKYTGAAGGVSVRKVLMGVQFCLSLILLGGTITVYRQLNYMLHTHPGYSRDQIAVVQAPVVADQSLGNKMQVLRTETLRDPGVHRISFSSDVPGRALNSFNSMWPSAVDESKSSSVFMMEIDEQFLPVYKIDLIAGRNFTATDSTEISEAKDAQILVNETLTRRLGFRQPVDAVNQQVLFRPDGRVASARIIGVVKDYHQRSMKEGYDAIAYYFPDWNRWKYISVSIDEKNMTQSVSQMKKNYTNLFPGNGFELFFMDEYFQRQYASDRSFSMLVLVFTVIAVFVSAMGILGLTGLMMQVRLREIGIRKVLGATTSGLLYLFSKDVIRIILLAFSIAAPVGYYFSQQWLNHYFFRVSLTWMTGLLPFGLLVTVALSTITLITWRAAGTNPANTLRSE